MEVNNPLYKNQGIHVISTIFTIEKGAIKVLLVKRKNKPFQGYWSLVGGALYNNEELETGMAREIFEKAGLENIELRAFKNFSKINRSPIQRMIAVSYIGLIDFKKIELLKETQKSSDVAWIAIEKINELAYDHKEILEESIKELQVQIMNTDILRILYPKGFTIPEIQKVYEGVLNKTFERRNFRRKLLSLDLIEDTGDYEIFEGRKPAKIYKLKKSKENKNIL